MRTIDQTAGLLADDRNWQRPEEALIVRGLRIPFVSYQSLSDFQVSCREWQRESSSDQLERSRDTESSRD